MAIFILAPRVRREVISTAESVLDAMCAEGRTRDAIRLTLDLLRFVRLENATEPAAVRLLATSTAALNGAAS